MLNSKNLSVSIIPSTASIPTYFPFYSILALTTLRPLSSPMVRLTVTGFAKPFRFAPSVSAANSKAPERKGWIDAELYPVSIPSPSVRKDAVVTNIPDLLKRALR